MQYSYVLPHLEQINLFLRASVILVVVLFLVRCCVFRSVFVHEMCIVY